VSTTVLFDQSVDAPTRYESQANVTLSPSLSVKGFAVRAQ